MEKMNEIALPGCVGAIDVVSLIFKHSITTPLTPDEISSTSENGNWLFGGRVRGHDRGRTIAHIGTRSRT
ncbi:hypothetical protein MAR_035082 [Mya arenaria]|uniref:Uncharacterized protein n=1 Tax=Mya arenaria TaxID=6604 RepID=A0ABY7EMH2_MYAAR|nr:hypothetical protein MAR_035082 [Mya arenaria]